MVRYIFRGTFDDENSDDEDGKIRFKHNPIVRDEGLNAINYLASEHVRGLQ